eukprot:gene12641-26624_t
MTTCCDKPTILPMLNTRSTQCRRPRQKHQVEAGFGGERKVRRDIGRRHHCSAGHGGKYRSTSPPKSSRSKPWKPVSKWKPHQLTLIWTGSAPARSKPKIQVPGTAAMRCPYRARRSGFPHMSLPSTAAIPLLKPGITITPYQDDAASATPRFLLALGDQYFLVSEKARALVLALLRTPADDGELEAGFESETGLRVPASQLLAMAGKTLPPALFHDAPEPPRELPFVVSLTLLGPRLATRVTACLSWMFTPALAMPLVLLF